MMKKLAIAIGITLMLCNIAIAQKIALQIEGPHEVAPGSLVRLVANTITNETPFWIVLQPIDLDYEQVEEGRRLLFSAGCCAGQKITVVLLAQQVKDGRIVTRQIRRTIRVIGNDVTPAPIKDPTSPDQTPVTKSPIFKAIANAWPAIRTDAAKELSGDVATNIDAMASRCESGTVEDIPSIWRELSIQNRQTLGIESTAWNPVAKVLQAEFQQLDLKTPEEHAFHLRAAAAAIRNSANGIRLQNDKSTFPRSQR